VPRDAGGILPHLAPGLEHFRVALCYLGCLCWALQAPRVCVPSVSLIGGRAGCSVLGEGWCVWLLFRQLNSTKPPEQIQLLKLVCFVAFVF